MKTNITKTEGAVKQSRRKFLKAGGLAAAAAAGTVAMPNVSRAQTVTLKLQSSWVAADPFSDMAQQYVQRVNEMAGNRLKIDYLLGGAVVHPFSVQDAVHNGVIDATHTVPVYWYGKHKAASLFGTGPVFGFNAEQGLGWIYYGGGKELYKELIDDILKLNIVSFFSMPMPTQPLGWFKKPVRSAADMKGLKYRTVGLAADLMQVMGAAVAQIPGGEIVPAMERGVIDAFEFNNPSSDLRFGAQDVAKNYFLASYHQASESFEFLFNKDFFDDLEPDLQAILKYGVEAITMANTALALDFYSKDLQTLQDEHGVTVHRTSQEILDAQLNAWDELIKELEEDEFMKRCMESQRQWVERTVFYELMNAPDYALAYEHYFPGKLKT